MKKVINILFHPFSLIILGSAGILSFIELMHISYHHKMEHDIHGHVREYCRNNPDVCQYKD